MNKSRWSIALIALLMTFTLVISACATPTEVPAEATEAPAEVEEPAATEVVEEPAEPPSEPVALIMGLSSEPTNLDPLIQGGTSQRAVKGAIYRGLFNYCKGGEICPELAESYEISEDGLTYTFKLREAVFHNGDPVTAEDVKFSLERIMDPESGASFSHYFSVVDSVDVVDENTVSVVLNQVTAPFLDYLSLAESAIVSKAWTEEHDGSLAEAPMGAGPFEFVEYLSGQHILVKKFDDFYKDGYPMADEIYFEFYGDGNTRVIALQSGDVDLIEYVPWKDKATLVADDGVQILGGTGPFMALVFNANHEAFSNPLVRQAVGYAIDRQVVIDTAFSGEGIPLFGMNMPSNSIAYDPQFDNYFAYDPEKAKELLAEAGYPDGFTATLLSTSQYDMHQNTAIAVQSELQKIGIETELDLPDWATRLEQNLAADYDYLVVGTAGDITDPDFLADYYENASGEIRYNNSPGFVDERIDELLILGRSTVDPAERKAYYQELQQRALDLSPLVYLMWRDQSYAASNDVQGFEPLPGFLSFQSGYMLEEAYK